MGALQSKRNRSLDSVWTSNKDIIAVLEAMMGVSIGTDNGPLFIQDAGQKIKDRVYVDKNTGKMYKCITSNSGITNDENFTEITLLSNSSEILVLDATQIYQIRRVQQNILYGHIGVSKHIATLHIAISVSVVSFTVGDIIAVIDDPLLRPKSRIVASLISATSDGSSYAVHVEINIDGSIKVAVSNNITVSVSRATSWTLNVPYLI